MAHKIIISAGWTLHGREQVYAALRKMGYDWMKGTAKVYRTVTTGTFPFTGPCHIYATLDNLSVSLKQNQVEVIEALGEVAAVVVEEAIQFAD